MENQANTEIVKRLLESKNNMEKSADFAADSIRRAQNTNPAEKFRQVQLIQVIQDLKDTQGDARKSAIAKLVKSLNVKSASGKCSKCGAQIEVGARFCENCGTQLVNS